MIVPDKTRTFDKDRPLTAYTELIKRHVGTIPYDHSDKHHTVWTYETFMSDMFALSEFFPFKIADSQNPDDKVGNGFTVLLEKI